MAALPNIEPGFELQPLGFSEEELSYAFEAKRAALGPHIEKRWAWDEAFQFDFHRRRYAERPFFRIVLDGVAIGVVSIMRCPDHVRFGEFYIFPEHQGRGLGTRILRHAMTLADEASLPVLLEYLKWNPVGSLYLRHGFKVTHETETHYFLERKPVTAHVHMERA